MRSPLTARSRRDSLVICSVKLWALVGRWRWKPASDLVEHLSDLASRLANLRVSFQTVFMFGDGSAQSLDQQHQSFDRDCEAAGGINHHGQLNITPAVHQRDGTSEHVRLVARLLAKRRLGPGSGCWLWLGRRDRWGYGRITVAHRRWSVHRLAAHLYLGLDPESELHVLHRCPNPACFRPSHLYLGTNADNVRDRVARPDR